MKNDLKNIFQEKPFTILLSLIFIYALICEFYNFELLGACSVLILLLILVLFFNLGFRKSIILYLIFFAGILRADLSKTPYSPLEDINSDNAGFYAQIVSSKNITNKNQKVKFFIRIIDAKIENKNYKNLNSKALVTMDLNDEIKNKITIGDYILLDGKLRILNPSNNPYQFDYKKYLENQNCKNVIYGSNSTLKIIKHPHFGENINDSWEYILQKFELKRNEIIKKHAKYIKSPQLEVLGGIVFGSETINPDETIVEQFKTSGLLHLLAASGLNVALIYGIWWQIANMLKLPYNFSILTGAFFVIFYTFMTGFPPSILRAGIMLLFVLFGKIIDRKASSLALIFFVGFLILLFCPKMLFDIGFQLSFVVTIGLVACCDVIINKFDKIDEKYRKNHNKEHFVKKYFYLLFSPKNLAGIVAVPLVAQIWVVPLQMHYFYNFAPLSILANICCVPFIGLLSFIGFLGSILALCPYVFDKFIFIFDMTAKPLLALLIKISEIFSSYKYSLLTTFGLNIFQIFLYWVLVVLITILIGQNFKNKKILAVFISCLVIFSFTFINFDNYAHNLEVVMFDVKNADSFLIKTPKNKYIMIDTGKLTYKGTNDAKIIMAPYLNNKRIHTIDYLIITHFDSDHSGGALDILKNYRVKNIIIQNEVEKSLLSANILNYIKQNKLNYKIAKNNETILKEKDLEIKTLIANLDEKEDNENSIVTLLSYKDKNLLFMADAGIRGFRAIKDKLPKPVYLIKIGHHGAKNTINQKIIDEFKPNYALISAGQNKYNHPDIKTVNILLDNDIKTIISRNYGFVKIVFPSNMSNSVKFSHFNCENKKMENLNFSSEHEDFYKSDFIKRFVQENTL